MSLSRNRNPAKASRRLLQIAVLSISAALSSGCSEKVDDPNQDLPFITTPSPIRIVSANDGDALKFLGLPRSDLPDSVTVIDLSADSPPVTRTVSGTVPNSYSGSPIAALISGGRYAFIPSHDFGYTDEAGGTPSQVTVVDLDDPRLNVVKTFPLPKHPWQAMAHPDDERVIVISDHRFHLFQMVQNQPQLVSESAPISGYLTSFAIGPDGNSIVATVANELDFSTEVELHLFSLVGNTVTHISKIESEPEAGEIDQPFAPRFSPDGTRVLVLNGLGISNKPPLDAVLSIDMTLDVPLVTDSIPNVAQGLESVAFHPSGRFAVVTCIDGPLVGHLAVIDMTASPIRVLSYVPMTFVPQGIEFSPDGIMLFVQSNAAHHIDVYGVEGMNLSRKPYVLRTGEGPATMAISSR